MGFDPRPRDRLIAERLSYLFQTVHPKDRGPYTPAEVADAINQAAGGEKVISATYVWQLRTGRRDNPTYKHLVALARFFGVPAEYFFDDADLQGGISAVALAAFRDERARDVALRSIGLSERAIKVILEMIEHARNLENLKEPEPPSGDGSSAAGPDAGGPGRES